MVSEVILVTNPVPHVSTHRWIVTNLQNLNRKNKMTSFPFWIPNDRMKKHQLRLVLLRGIAKRDDPMDEAIGLVVEVIPPPLEGLDASARKLTFPGGCAVTVRVVSVAESERQEELSSSPPPLEMATPAASSNTSGEDYQKTYAAVIFSEFATLNETNPQLTFEEVLTRETLENAALVANNGDAVTLEITVETGVDVAAKQVAKTASSLWSSLTTSVNQLVQKAIHAYPSTDAREEHGAERKPEGAMVLPWDATPPTWSTRVEEWRDLVAMKIAEDEGTFIYGPDRGLSIEEQQLLSHVGLSHRTLTDAHTLFDYDRDVHEGLLSAPAVRSQRYHLVPRRLKEEVFWANYFWKVSALSICTNDEQVRVVLTILNAPPATEPRAQHAAATASEEAVQTYIKDAQESSDLLGEFLADNADDDGSNMYVIEAAVQSAEEHLKHLEALFTRKDLSEELSKQVSTTMKKLRDRVSSLITRQQSAAAKMAQDTSDSAFVPDAEDTTSTEGAILEGVVISPRAPTQVPIPTIHTPAPTEEPLSTSAGEVPKETEGNPEAPSRSVQEAEIPPAEKAIPEEASHATESAQQTAVPEQTTTTQDEKKPVEAEIPLPVAAPTPSKAADSLSFEKMPWEEDEP